MPVVEVKIAGKLTDGQKKEIAEKITALMENVAGKPKKYTYVIFTEKESGDFAIGGEMI
jgi:4-oxalocrotonate tautomerase